MAKITIDPKLIRTAGDPPPEPSPDEIREVKALAKEHQELRDARLAVLDEWSYLENSLVQLLALAGGVQDPVVASILYFSSHSFRTRQQMLDRLIDHLEFSEKLEVEHAAEWKTLSREWKTLSNTLRDQKPCRDAAAHGVIQTTHDGESNTAVIADVPMQMHTMLSAFRLGKPLGKSLSDLRAAIPAIRRRRERVDRFRARLLQHLQARAEVIARWRAGLAKHHKS